MRVQRLAYSLFAFQFAILGTSVRACAFYNVFAAAQLSRLPSLALALVCGSAMRPVLGCDANQITCRSVVLASISAYFRGLFAGAGCHMQHGMPNPNTAPGSPNASIVNLPACEPQQLLAVVTAIYTQQLQVLEGPLRAQKPLHDLTCGAWAVQTTRRSHQSACALQVSAANVQQLMTCSDFLGVTVVMDACCEVSSHHAFTANACAAFGVFSVLLDWLTCVRPCNAQFLTQQLDVHTCLATLQLAVHFKSQQLLQKTVGSASNTAKYPNSAQSRGSAIRQWFRTSTSTDAQSVSCGRILQVASVKASAMFTLCRWRLPAQTSRSWSLWWRAQNPTSGRR